MVDRQDLLVEIGTEELPPKALDRLSAAFQNGLETQLEQNGLSYDSIQRFATPRRLALVVSTLDSAQADRTV